MAGRPPKPYVLHKAEGTDRARVKAREADKLHLEPGSIGEAPSWFTPVQMEEWTRITTHGELKQIVTAADRALLIHYCVLWERFVEDAQKIEKMTASERQTFHSIQMQLGFTPASRSKVLAPKKPEPENKWLALAK